jgi:DNA-binding GntR family transcriptional regulator
MGTSTTPVREAFRQLAAEGLVDLDSHRGVVVHTPTAEEVDEIYELRMTLEPLGIRKASVAVGPNDVATAEALCERMDAEPSIGPWTELNREFHTVLLAASRRPLLVELLTNLRDRSSLYVALSLSDGDERMAKANAEHRELLECVKTRDVDRATQIMTHHLSSTVDAALGQLAKPADE